MERRYDAKEYNCAHFVCDVWKDLKGESIAEVMRGFLCGRTSRAAILSDLKKVSLLEKPTDLCLVFFQGIRGKNHVGVWFKKKVLHIEPGGVKYQPLEVVSIGFKKVRFFVC